MKSAEVEVNPKIIDYVLKKVKNENIDPVYLEVLEKWKDGTIIPRFTDIEKISNKTHIAPGIFFLDNPPKEEDILIEFRSINNISDTLNFSIDLKDTINYMQDIQDWMSEYQKNFYDEKLSFIHSISIYDTHLAVAQKVRKLLNIPSDWFINQKDKKVIINELKLKFSDLNILTIFNGIVKENIYRNLDVSEFRAFALIDDYAPLIFINNNDSDSAKIFSLLHEFVHLLVGENDLLISNVSEDTNKASSDIELFCNNVAAEVLMPKEIFKQLWLESNTNNKKKISDIAQSFNTSTLATLVRAYNLNLIDFENYTHLKKYFSFNKKTYESSSGGNYWNTKFSRYDNKFLKAIINSVKDGNTQLTEAFRLTNTNAKTYLKLVESLGE